MCFIIVGVRRLRLVFMCFIIVGVVAVAPRVHAFIIVGVRQLRLVFMRFIIVGVRRFRLVFMRFIIVGVRQLHLVFMCFTIVGVRHVWSDGHAATEIEASDWLTECAMYGQTDPRPHPLLSTPGARLLALLACAPIPDIQTPIATPLSPPTPVLSTQSFQETYCF